MRGIVVSDFESLIKNGDMKINEIRDEIQQLNTDSLELRRSISSSELSFLTDNLYYEVKENSKVTKKLGAYQVIFNNVYRAYKDQVEEVATAIKRVTPKV